MDETDQPSPPEAIQSLLRELSARIQELPAENRQALDPLVQQIRAAAGDWPDPAGSDRYLELAESISDPLTLYDGELRLVYQNQAVQAATNQPDEQVLGRTFTDLFPGLAGSDIHQAYLRVLATHRPERIRTRRGKPVGEQDIFYDLSIHPFNGGLVVYSKDVTEWKRIEDLLRESEGKFFHMFEKAPVAISLFDVDEGIIVDVNPAWLRLFGFSKEEVIGKSSVDLDIITDLAARDRAFAELHRVGCIRDWEIAYRRRTGEPLTLLVNIDQVTIGEKHYYLRTMQDITDRKRTEKELQEALAALSTERNRLLAVMEALPAGLAIYDDKGGVIQANRAFEEVWGSPRPPADSVDDYDAYKAWWVESGERVKPEEWAAALAVQKGETAAGQFIRIQRFDGSTGYILNSGAPIFDARGKIAGSAVVILDITDLTRAREALKVSEERFRVALAAVPLLVYTCDLDLRYTWVYNPLRGYRAEDVLGKRDDEMMPAEAARELIEAKQRVVDSGQGAISEVKVPAGAQDYYYVLAVEPTWGPHGALEGLICSAIDITEQKLLQLQQQEQAQQIEVQRRLMDFREMERETIARDLHDGPIQTLASAGFHIQYVREVCQDASLRDRLEDIAGSVKHTMRELRDIMNDLRPPALIRFGLGRTIRMHAEDVQDRYPDIHISLEMDDQGVRMSDQTSLNMFRIFQEALNNAIRHSGASEVKVRYQAGADGFVLEVSDNGEGFLTGEDPLDLARTGRLGLAGMQARVKAVGGELLITSQPGQGTTVSVRSQPGPAQA